MTNSCEMLVREAKKLGRCDVPYHSKWEEEAQVQLHAVEVLLSNKRVGHLQP